MFSLKELSEKYIGKDFSDLTSKDKRDLRTNLQLISKSPIVSINEAQKYLELLRIFRQAVKEDLEFQGENFNKLLNSLLTVGEDGVYSDSLRCLYELIQNVDDCDYINSNNCKLTIKFNTNNLEDTIILEYNEKGFTPENVFSITGIAEQSKNILENKTQIGEKGIGFKSVFGVAKKVLIQSSLFSFELDKDNFTVPIPKYDNFKEISGTRMTLFLMQGKAQELKNKILNDYQEKDALFNKNPILFLNKLTELEIKFDESNRIIFNVSNKKSYYENYTPHETIYFSSKIVGKSNRKVSEKPIKCFKYTMPIVYDLKECQSRYGDNTKVAGTNGKRMYIYCIIPQPDYAKKVKKGTLYSFFPTQIILNVPILIHAPFKLSASREFVDPRDKNNNKESLWFIKTCEVIGELLHRAYLDFARISKGNIIQYLPIKNFDSIFKQTNDKVICLCEYNDFKAKRFLNLPIFYTSNNQLTYNTEITCINPEEVNDRKEMELVYKLLGEKKYLFNCPINLTKEQLENVNVKVISDIDKKVFEQAFYNKEVTQEALDYLAKKSNGFKKANLKELKKQCIDIEQLKIFIDNPNTLKLLEEYSIANLRDSKLKKLFLNPCPEQENAINIDDNYSNILNLDSAPKELREYLGKSKTILKLNIKSKEKFFVCMDNFLILSENDKESFAELRIKINPKDLYSIKIRLENISKEIEQKIKDDNISPKDFLISLKDYQELAPDILVEKFMEQIHESSCDSKRFVKELLQNADDCDFISNIIPSFSIEIINKDNEKIIHTSCNEIGFTKANLWAITNIGESTKKKIFNNSQDKTGEKGVGFKTVFGVANKVTIHSGDLLFSLTKEKPIIPIASKSQNIEKIDGTQMDFILDKAYNFDYDTEKDIIGLCVCLHNLKDITIPRFKIKIEDNDNERIIIINDKKYILTKNIYSFEVKDQQLLNERSKNGEKEIRQSQKIICYFFKDKKNEPENFQYKLYSTLPISNVTLKIPFIIDAPFELIDSRENVIHNNWNNMVRNEMYNAIIDTIIKNKDSLKNRILDYFIFKDKVFVLSFSCNWLDSHNYINIIQKISFLPTYEDNHFASPDQKCKLVPPVIKYLLNKKENLDIERNTILNLPVSDEYKPIFEALNCNFIEDSLAISLLEPYIDKYINDEEFRKRLYSYLKNIDDDLYIKIRNLKIIPVYSSDGKSTNFINWQEDKIFTKKDTKKSENNYYVLNVSILPRNDCEAILGNVTINEMNFEYEKSKYNKDLYNKIINETSNQKSYYQILNEFNNGNLEKYDAKYTVKRLFEENKLPLKNVLGEYITGKSLFIDKDNSFPFSGILQKIILDKEAIDLAKYCLNLKNITDITYYDLWNINESFKQLTSDDIEAFINGSFTYESDLIGTFLKNGYISNELKEEYNLDCYAYSKIDFSDLENDSDFEDDFPNSSYIDFRYLHQSFLKRFNNLETIEYVPKETFIKKVNFNGKLSDINSTELRKEAIQRYIIPKSKDKCFCQMCKKQININFVEANNIEREPKYYWKEMRITLCLVCSKIFKSYRGNDSFYNDFINNLLNVNIENNLGPIEVKIGPKDDDKTIVFSRLHLAEIQEILKFQLNKSNLEDK